MSGLGVSTHGLVHVYRTGGQDVAALSGVDLTIAPGETVCLLGPSGSGKSTLLSLIGGLQRPSAGVIRVGSRSLTDMDDDDLARMRTGELGLLVQGGGRNLIPYLDGRENVAFAQSLHRGRRLPSPDDVLASVGAGAASTLLPRRMSAAEAQLVALAVAMACSPGLLLADEPTASLTHDARDRVLEALHEVNRVSGVTVIAVSHDDAVAQALHRTITIRDGRVGAEGRGGLEFAVVSADGSLPLPPHVLEHLPPGTSVRIDAGEDAWELRRVDGSERP